MLGEKPERKAGHNGLRRILNPAYGSKGVACVVTKVKGDIAFGKSVGGLLHASISLG